MSNKRLLFIPVSSPQGIGEYMRSLLLAQSLQNECSNTLDIHFILNKHTAYAKSCPFNTTLLEHSPTKELDKVCQFITEYKPDVVIFDCAGRAAHMKAAKKVGAKVVFISQHAKKRAKGLKLNRINLIDSHWVVQPDYCIEPLSWAEKTKIDMFSLAMPKNVGPYIAFSSKQQTQQVLDTYKLDKKDYFIVSAGSGGHLLNGENCADVFFAAAEQISSKTGLKGIVVFGANYNKTLPISSTVISLTSLDNSEFLSLLEQAKFALLSAGDTLLQAIAVNTPAVACAISKDQNERLTSCESTGVVLKARFDKNDIINKVEALLIEPHFKELLSKYSQFKNAQGYDVITQGVKNMLLDKH
ncbi:glycosyltransferase family 1 protein [Pseudoalteromonas carrageenovora]|uniref:glycosyltransferase family 1 protein n=1 Tax=Pseudoalteromonas carrageenovora TaxID=227 RepID=UPI0026E31F8A|nr:glycosyltransferase family 1 protein [Pseudoalteromonas carrageenovora]MDO6637353.1 glycosyltransferase family 1 protein [Pseudoalteromonas carrageenovora]MDO6649741.1 glycosyltransferase family 1 protein [Pseudoalteromonas carrageenovora]